MPPATVGVFLTRALSPSFNTQQPQIAMTSELTLASFSHSSLSLSIIASSSKLPLLTMKFLPPELHFQVYRALRVILELIVFDVAD